MTILTIILSFFIGSLFAFDVPFPELSGKYDVVSKTLLLKDYTRMDVISSYGNKGSGCTAPKDYRRIPVTIYAPAIFHSHKRNTYLPEVLVKHMGLPSEMASVTKRSFALDHETKSLEKLPVIFFSPGLGISSLFYTAFLEEVASHGYLIFAFSHPYMSGNVYEPEKNCIIPMIDLPIDRVELVSLLGEMIEENVKDFSFVRKKLEELKISTDKIFLVGHSGGGMSATYYCDRRDISCTGVVNLDGGDIDGIGIEVDGAWPTDKNLSFLKLHSASFPNLDRIKDSDFGRDQYLIDIKKIDHQTFSDKAFFPGMVGHEGDELLSPFISQKIINDHVLSYLLARSQSLNTEIIWPVYTDDLKDLFTKRM